MRSSVLFTFLLILLPPDAPAQQAKLERIQQLSRNIHQATRWSRASDAELDEVTLQLEAALKILQGEAGEGSLFNPPGCFEFAYGAYYRDLNSGPATDKALASCKQVADLEVLKFLFSAYYKDLNSAPSVEKAATQSGLELRGKLDMLKYAYSAFYRDLNSAPSAERAVEGISKLKPGRVGCLTQLYTAYYRDLNSAPAIEKAIRGCQN